jgi:hypothetical protein
VPRERVIDHRDGHARIVVEALGRRAPASPGCHGPLRLSRWRPMNDAFGFWFYGGPSPA